ncbi:MAG: hypothetical protein ABI595_13005 [Actinomycetota bacterium]
MIRSLDPDTDAVSCDGIIASLPAWFGMEDGIRECAEAVRTQPGLVAEVDGSVTGFLTVAVPTLQPRRSRGWPCTPAIVGAASAER